MTASVFKSNDRSKGPSIGGLIYRFKNFFDDHPTGLILDGPHA